MVSSHSYLHLAEIDAGALKIRPTARCIEGRAGMVTVEPLVMQLLVELARHAGEVVSRQQIFEHCWGGAVVGDDSLNRVVTLLRKALAKAADGSATVETVTGAGYVLRLNSDAAGRSAGQTADSASQSALRAGLDSLRLNLPEVDHLRLEILRRAIETDPNNAELWGMSSLLYREAVEYAEPDSTTDYLSRCEAHARRALELDPKQPEARVAIATAPPLFHNWDQAHERLAEAAHDCNFKFTAAHELAIVEMATGRVSVAKGLIDQLISADPLAACLNYKSMYQHWSVGDRIGLDRVADRAIHLWPTHPAVWTSRFWTLAYTGRPHAALDMTEDPAVRPNIPPPALQLLRKAVSARISGAPSEIDAASQMARQAAHVGPSGANAAIFTLGLLERVDEQSSVADAYYLREGPTPVPVRRSQLEPSINQQHRRVTQILFTPACAAFRQQERFWLLCERIGLAEYWRNQGFTPDFAR